MHGTMWDVSCGVLLIGLCVWGQMLSSTLRRRTRSKSNLTEAGKVLVPPLCIMKGTRAISDGCAPVRLYRIILDFMIML